LSLELAHASDISGAAWLTSEFGMTLRPYARPMIDEAIARYENHPEVLGNPKMKMRYDVLKLDS
jgi:hypothetical protein